MKLDFGDVLEYEVYDLEHARPAGWVRTGFCGVCVLPIEAWQPGGQNPRHIDTKAPLCKAKPA